MIPEIGHFALILALCLALLQGSLPLIGAHKGIVPWINLARPLAQAQALFVTVAIGALIYAFVQNDFSVSYVAATSNTKLPIFYKVAGVWGGHEGSLLLWAFILSMWTVAVSLLSRHLPDDVVARVLGVMGLVSVGFLLFMLATSNPFARLLPGALEGRDLNPLLQDPGMVIHPPMLYMGYVGFSVAFAFAIAALLSGRLDAAWARWSRPWTTVAWVFLTLGIMLGSWWAYYELGWGGWWFWDPVENASFMPWLVGTALIHSLAVTEKRGSFKSWTVLLAIFAFSLSLLGTFLVRSGVLTSVHAFASDPSRGMAILAFLVVVVGGSLALYAWRAGTVGLGGRFELVSRESMLLGNNVVFAVAAGAVLLGTLYPLAMEALDMGKISVGPPYFDTIFLPLMAPAVFLMGIGPIARWKSASLPDIWTRIRWALAVAVVTALVLPFVLGKWTPLISVGLLMAAWLIATITENLLRKIKTARAQADSLAAEGSAVGRLAALPRSYLGMQLAHFGVAVFIIGVTMVKGYEIEQDLKMDIGSTTQIGGYSFLFKGISEVEGPNYAAQRGHFEVSKDGDKLYEMLPEKRVYPTQPQPMTEAAIVTRVQGDIYVSLGDPLPDGAWTVRVYIKPFVDWIWAGCVLMGLGGLLAVSDRRYRLAALKDRQKLAAAAPPMPPTPASTPTPVAASRHEA